MPRPTQAGIDFACRTESAYPADGAQDVPLRPLLASGQGHTLELRDGGTPVTLATISTSGLSTYSCLALKQPAAALTPQHQYQIAVDGTVVSTFTTALTADTTKPVVTAGDDENPNDGVTVSLTSDEPIVYAAATVDYPGDSVTIYCTLGAVPAGGRLTLPGEAKHGNPLHLFLFDASGNYAELDVKPVTPEGGCRLSGRGGSSTLAALVVTLGLALRLRRRTRR